MRGRIAALMTVVFGVLAAPAGAAAPPEHLTLRLADVGAGYRVGDDSGCGLDFDGEEQRPPALARIAARYHPEGCAIEFERQWPAPGPALAESYVFAFDDPAGAVESLVVARTLIAYNAGVRRGSLERRPAPFALGDEVAVFHTSDALVRGQPRHPGAAVLWRNGGVLALIVTGGRSAERHALDLARAAQGRIAAPTPLTTAANDDRAVALDDPRLGVPVVWLGATSQPSPALPRLALEESFTGPGPGWRLVIEYDAGVMLGLWRPRAFARFEHTRLGRFVRTQRCTRAERIAVPGGRAVIFSGYAKPPRRCGRRPRDVHFAQVDLDGVVVTVNLPFCSLCVDAGRDGPYDTAAGMKAVAGALRPRVSAAGAGP